MDHFRLLRPQSWLSGNCGMLSGVCSSLSKPAGVGNFGRGGIFGQGAVMLGCWGGGGNRIIGGGRGWGGGGGQD
jgi:hypothetical protein